MIALERISVVVVEKAALTSYTLREKEGGKEEKEGIYTREDKKTRKYRRIEENTKMRVQVSKAAARTFGEDD